jgi:hypothetical protein
VTGPRTAAPGDRPPADDAARRLFAGGRAFAYIPSSP